MEDRDCRFLDQYLGYELRYHRWIHLKKEDAILLAKDNPTFAVDACYQFEFFGVEYNYYHMDTHLCIQSIDHKLFEYKISIRNARTS